MDFYQDMWKHAVVFDMHFMIYISSAQAFRPNGKKVVWKTNGGRWILQASYCNAIYTSPHMCTTHHLSTSKPTLSRKTKRPMALKESQMHRLRVQRVALPHSCNVCRRPPAGQPLGERHAQHKPNNHLQARQHYPSFSCVWPCSWRVYGSVTAGVRVHQSALLYTRYAWLHMDNPGIHLNPDCGVELINGGEATFRKRGNEFALLSWRRVQLQLRRCPVIRCLRHYMCPSHGASSRNGEHCDSPKDVFSCNLWNRSVLDV